MTSTTAARPWWQTLPADYYQHPYATLLDRSDPLTVSYTHLTLPTKRIV